MSTKKERANGALILFGAAFCIIPSFILWLVGATIFERQAVKGWLERPCRIERVEVTHPIIDRFELTATYSYFVDGVTNTSSVVGLGGRTVYSFESLRDRLPLLKKYARGSEHVCHVDPSNPASAVLLVSEGESDGWGLVLAVVLIAYFLLAGLFLITRAFPGIRRREPKIIMPLSVMFFGGIFGLLFASVGIGMIAKDGRHRAAAEHYLPTPAKVLYSGVESHRSSSGKGGSKTVYRAVVGYAYEVDGVAYENDRLSFFKTSSSNYGKHRREADRYKQGDTITVWRSPTNPRETVIVRTEGVAWSIGALVFAVFGLAVLSASIWGFVKSWRRERRVRSLISFCNRPLRRSYADVIAIGLWAFMWNGISWTVLLGCYAPTNFWQFPAVLLPLIFPTIGLAAVVVFVCWLVRKVRGPYFRVLVSCSDWKPGAAVSVTLEQVGEGVIGSFRVLLEQTLKFDAFSKERRGVPHQPAPARSREVFRGSFSSGVGGFSFVIPDCFTMDATDWEFKLSYRVAGRRKERKSVYEIPV